MGEGTRESPYTREDILKLIEQNRRTANKLDLTNKNLEKVDLSGLDLKGIVLSKANLEYANLQGTDFRGVGVKRYLIREIVTKGLTSPEPTPKSDAFITDTHAMFGDPTNFEGANLSFADLTDAKLWGATMINTRLIRANLKRANLWKANLFKADLGGANLESTSFNEAKMAKVSLQNTTIYSSTDLHDVNWGKEYKVWEERSIFFEEAGREYRELKKWHNQAGLYGIAGEFYYKEMVVNRKSLLDLSWFLGVLLFGVPHEERPKLHPFRWVWSTLVNILCGYGERPFRVVASALIIIFGLALIYHNLGNLLPNTYLESLYYSAVSFTAVGYGNWAPEPLGWAKGMGVIEALLGVFMMALFLVTFTRKMTR